MIDLAGKTPVLMMIDPQVEATEEDQGSLHSIGSTDALPNCVRILEAARAVGMPVIFTVEIHRKEMVDFGRLLDGTEPVHCVEDTPGVELCPDTRPRSGEWLIEGRRYSKFVGTDLDLLLRGLGSDTLLCCGFLTDVCVHYTCVDAHQLDYSYFVARDATAGSTPEASEAALDRLEYFQTGSLVTTDDMIAAIDSYRGSLATAAR
ncbi:MAG TPA: cysteine hydrolase [Thermoleophilaceae bacterium]|nr:cysteine hydrolase [Thermoleophilaceae bacterium]